MDRMKTRQKAFDLQLFASTYEQPKKATTDAGITYVSSGGGRRASSGGRAGSGYATGSYGRTPSSENSYSRNSGYRASSDVAAAKSALDNVIAGKPGDFSSQYDEDIAGIYDKIMNREAFSYDLGSDMLYQQYKDQYTALGKTAMADTMGQASMLTGGYGSTYATAAGQQAYQGYLQQLNDVVPELYSMSLDKYKQEGEDLYNRYGLASDMRNTEYNEYRDAVSDYYNDLSYAQSSYQDERNFDFGSYQQGVSEKQWQQEFDAEQAYNSWYQQFQENQAAQEQSNWQANYDAAQAKASSTSTGAGTGTDSASGSDSASDAKIDGATIDSIYSSVDNIVNSLAGNLDPMVDKNKIIQKIKSTFTGDQYTEAMTYFKVHYADYFSRKGA